MRRTMWLCGYEEGYVHWARCLIPWEKIRSAALPYLALPRRGLLSLISCKNRRDHPQNFPHGVFVSVRGLSYRSDAQSPVCSNGLVQAFNGISVVNSFTFSSVLEAEGRPIGIDRITTFFTESYRSF